MGSRNGENRNGPASSRPNATAYTSQPCHAHGIPQPHPYFFLVNQYFLLIIAIFLDGRRSHVPDPSML